MSQAAITSSIPLYERDETAWLEQMSRLIAQGRFDKVDREHLAEYLSDMAIRDKREVFSRLVILITHLLKWEHQPKRRTNSWRGTIGHQRLELAQLLESAILRRHAGRVLDKAYRAAIKQAAAETGLAEGKFPSQCSMSLEQILADK